MTPASIILLLLASVCAAAAHLIWGRSWLQLGIFWLAAFGGCLIVYASGLRLPFGFPNPAGVPLLECVVMAWILLVVASRLRL